MNMLEQAKQLEPFITDFRHDLHRHPELSFQEFRTTEKIEEELKKLGLSYTRFEPTGLMVEIEGRGSGKRVGLRADMDALPIQETTGLDYQSETANVMHACGHDTHTAMLMGAVKLLAANRDKLNGTVRCIFQPAEEIAKGAAQVISQGAAEGVDMFFGEHATPLQPSGAINYCPGGALAASVKFQIDVHGRAAHGATPEFSVDATLIGCEIVSSLQSIISRNVSPFDTCVLSVGSFHSGSAFNVISDHAVITGTCRFLNPALEDTLRERMQSIVSHVAAAHGATAELDFDVSCDVVYNDAAVLDLVWQAAGRFADLDKCKQQMAPITGGDDFGAYGKFAPAAYVFIGMDGNGPGHNEKFRVGDNSLCIGAALYAQFAIEALNYLAENN